MRKKLAKKKEQIYTLEIILTIIAILLALFFVLPLFHNWAANLPILLHFCNHTACIVYSLIWFAFVVIGLYFLYKKYFAKNKNKTNHSKKKSEKQNTNKHWTNMSHTWIIAYVVVLVVGIILMNLIVCDVSGKMRFDMQSSNFGKLFGADSDISKSSKPSSGGGAGSDEVASSISCEKSSFPVCNGYCDVDYTCVETHSLSCECIKAGGDEPDLTPIPGSNKTCAEYAAMYDNPFQEGVTSNAECSTIAEANCDDGVLNYAWVADINCCIWKCMVKPSCTDADSDGYAIEGGDCGPVDCDDTNAAINPGATEDCKDYIDNDCDGLVDCDDVDDCTCNWCEDDLNIGDGCGGHCPPTEVCVVIGNNCFCAPEGATLCADSAAPACDGWCPGSMKCTLFGDICLCSGSAP